MPISSGFSQDPNPDLSYYGHKPGKTEMLDEAIYFERPVEIVDRPVIKKTIFMSDRRSPPLIHTRNIYVVSPEPEPIVSTTTSNVASHRSFHLIRTLRMNVSCPCWSWLCILFAFLVLLGLAAVCLYFTLKRYNYI
ncbi:unnamed protein product [Adineta steineri]|uniref:Uncharacterized protein n=1 Tax=Adineta steineri TaxID=433720 RepID=A0A819DJ29_9BILA|nr:unnamed protein product [Adineta steineri]